MTISCPSCGLAFETRATTNTRCRRCKTVVRIGSGSVRLASRVTQPATEELVGNGLIVVAAGVVILAFYVAPAMARFVRRRRADRAPSAAPGGPGAGQAQSAAIGEQPAAGAHTAPNRHDVNPAP